MHCKATSTTCAISTPIVHEILNHVKDIVLGIKDVFSLPICGCVFCFLTMIFYDDYKFFEAVTFLETHWDGLHLGSHIEFLPGPNFSSSVHLESISSGNIDLFDSSLPRPPLVLYKDTLDHFSIIKTCFFNYLGYC
jgi:hypothetical protein